MLSNTEHCLVPRRLWRERCGAEEKRGQVLRAVGGRRAGAGQGEAQRAVQGLLRAG